MIPPVYSETRRQTVTFIKSFSQSKSKCILNEDVFLFIINTYCLVPVVCQTLCLVLRRQRRRESVLKASVLTIWGETVTPANSDGGATTALRQLTYLVLSKHMKVSAFLEGQGMLWKAAGGRARKDGNTSVTGR